jgi:hypothetical protein
VSSTSWHPTIFDRGLPGRCPPVFSSLWSDAYKLLRLLVAVPARDTHRFFVWAGWDLT